MYRVIIVDDEPLIRKGLRETIEWDELELELAGEASNGSEAFEIIKKVKPQIIITDIKMPVMDGLELIRKIHENDLNIKIIILSGYSDYEFLKEAIRFGVESYLLKPIDNDELISILTSTVKSIEEEIFSKILQREGVMALRNNTLNRLITNSINVKEYKEKAALLNIDFSGSEFIVAVAMLDNCENNPALGEDNQLKLFAVLNISEEITRLNNLGAVFVDARGRVVFLLNNGQVELQRDLVEATLSNIVGSIKMDLKLFIFIGVGFKVESLVNVYKSYDAAVKCLDYGMITNNDSFIHYAETNSNKSNADNIKIDFALIETLIRLEKKAELIQYIDKCFDELAKLENITVEHLRDLVMQIVICIIKAIGETNGDMMGTANSLGFNYAALLNFNRLNEFKSCLKSFCERVMNLLFNQINKKVSKAVKDTINYISEHYYEDISLKSVSEIIYINASYLGQIFKKEAGESFTDYVNRYRVQKAKELLSTTNMKVYEVSAKVGFTDSHYFIKIFKKYAGVNPSDIKRIG